MECSLRDLRYKEVISVADGSRYGYVGDVEIRSGERTGADADYSGQPRFFGLFGRREDIAVRWDEVCRFGEDIILVEGTGCAGRQKSRGRGGLKRRGCSEGNRPRRFARAEEEFSLSAQKKVAKPRTHCDRVSKDYAHGGFCALCRHFDTTDPVGAKR